MNTIKEILASKTHNPHYLNKYSRFITNCQKKNESYSGYTEKHHICPKAQDMFPEFASFTSNPWNCIKLTARQHYIAHLLLYKTYPSVVSQQQALFLMSHSRGLVVSSTLYAKLRLELSKAKKGFVIVKDSEGKTFSVSIDDSRYLSGELVHHLKGRVTVRDSLGKTFIVSITDSRFLSGELVSINKGTVSVKNSSGNNSRVSIDDSRYLSGELVHNSTGTISKKRGLTDEQVREIRVAIKDPISVITTEFIASLVKPSQRDKVCSISFSKLKYKNGAPISYNSLIAKYYAKKYSVDKETITLIIHNKTYKEITT